MFNILYIYVLYTDIYKHIHIYVAFENTIHFEQAISESLIKIY